MTVDRRLLRKEFETRRIVHAVAKLYSSNGRLKVRDGLSFLRACHIIRLGWRNAKILSLEYDNFSDWHDGKPGLDWPERSKKMQAEALKFAKRL
jgi:hypothetical protein